VGNGVWFGVGWYGVCGLDVCGGAGVCYGCCAWVGVGGRLVRVVGYHGCSMWVGMGIGFLGSRAMEAPVRLAGWGWVGVRCFFGGAGGGECDGLFSSYALEHSKFCTQYDYEHLQLKKTHVFCKSWCEMTDSCVLTEILFLYRI
jgi:hypothetical protein